MAKETAEKPISQAPQYELSEADILRFIESLYGVVEQFLQRNNK